MKENVLDRIDKVLKKRKSEGSKNSYVRQLFDQGNVEIIKKIREEFEELIEAAEEVDSDKKNKLIHEAADLCFHIMVLLSSEDITSKEVLTELEERFGISGIEEKNQRNNLSGE